MEKKSQLSREGHPSWIALLSVIGVVTLSALLLGSKTHRPAWEFAEEENYSGGKATVFDETRNAFALPVPGLDFEGSSQFAVGNSFFNQNWVIAPASTSARDGLGPLFNMRSCSGCHFKDGRGAPPSEGEEFSGLLLRLSIPGETLHGGPKPDPRYGGQLGTRAIPGVKPEGRALVTYAEVEGEYPDGTPYSLRKPHYTIEDLAYGALSEKLMISPRIAPPVFGMGLLEAIAEEDLLAGVDPEDRDGDGISGRVNRVWDFQKQETVVGRFGWKANQPTVRQQTAGAFLGDIGVTTPLFPEEDLSAAQSELRKLPHGGSPEVKRKLLDRVEFYLRALAVPARRNSDDPVVLVGKKAFHKVGCASCHTPQQRTAKDFPIAQLAGQKIWPYTDLLLHDMGEGLADGRPDYEASGREWRTPPLWGIGLTQKVNGHTFFLHDGRARNLEEAILWHGGEAQKSKEDFMELPREKREALLEFLNSL